MAAQLLTESPVRSRHFYLETVTFLVEGVLFKVPRRNFENDSEVFRDMFLLPVPEDELPEGSTDEKPITLDGVAEDDFVQLLRVMFPLQYQRQDPLSHPQWVSVLRLSGMWGFSAIHEEAIRQLSHHVERDPVTAVALARQFGVPQWLFPALQALAQREQPLQESDVAVLGVPDALRLAEVRESFHVLRGFCDCDCNGCVAHHRRTTFPSLNLTRSAHDFAPEIARVFKLAPTPAQGGSRRAQRQRSINTEECRAQ